jgi:hypothetical protein
VTNVLAEGTTKNNATNATMKSERMRTQ